ncbi:MAG: hypothetical protein HYT77_04550 [Deltaproteobacteria bacterium]|nr:hypothetical protein [Deltaproteobacteria bacterium]
MSTLNPLRSCSNNLGSAYVADEIGSCKKSENEEKGRRYLRQGGALAFLGFQTWAFYIAPKYWAGKAKWISKLDHRTPFDLLMNIAICGGLELLFNQSSHGEPGDRTWVFWPSQWEKIPETVMKWDLLPAATLILDGFSGGVLPKFGAEGRRFGQYQRMMTLGGRLKSREYICGDPIGLLKPGSRLAQAVDWFSSKMTKIPGKTLSANRLARWPGSFGGSMGRFGVFLADMIVMNVIYSLVWIPTLTLYIWSLDAPLEDKFDYALKGFIANVTLGSLRRTILWRIFPEKAMGSGAYYLCNTGGYVLVQGAIMMTNGSERSNG